MSENHARYGGPGVMIDWHVERTAPASTAQLTTCSAREVAAMLHGLLHHCTDADVEVKLHRHPRRVRYRFAFCYLLGFRLLPSLSDDHQRHAQAR